MSLIELHCAFFYDCDGCGREVFVKGLSVPIEQVLKTLPKKDRAVAKKYLGELGDCAIVAPRTVTCPHPDCGKTFEVSGEDDSE